MNGVDEKAFWEWAMQVGRSLLYLSLAVTGLAVMHILTFALLLYVLYQR